MPQPRPPYPAKSGLWGKPTIIQNVETLGNVPLILREGVAEYAKYGSEGSKGTKTFALAGNVARTGLVEVPFGSTLRKIVEDIGGGSPSGKPIKAVQTGGPSGGCIPASEFDKPVDYESLAELGSIMGSGGMVVLDEETCVVDLAKYFISFTQNESCGKCPPCRVGTRAMLHLLEKIAAGKGRMSDLRQLEELGDTVTKGSLCGLGQSAANPVLTTLRYFKQEYEEHIRNEQCSAFVCKDLVRFWIDEDRCTGCTACAKVCPVDAISGTKKELHVINQELCTQCGTCRNSCPATYAAIYRTSGKLKRYDEQKQSAKQKDA